MAHATIHPATAPRRSAALWVVAALGALLSMLLLFPGQYPFDSAYQLWQARSGHYNNLSPVTMPLTWSLLLETRAGPASLLMLNLAMAWCGWALCADALRLPTGWRIAGLLVTGCSPLLLVEMAHLLSDAHLAAVLVLATGLLADSAVRGGTWQRWLVLGLLVYAGAIRHNGIVAILPLGLLLARDFATAIRWRGGGIGFGGGAWLGAIAVALLSIGFGVALDRSVVDERKTTWTAIALWDLAAISIDSGELLLPTFAHGPGLTVAELVETRAFDPVSNIYLYVRSRSGIAAGLLAPFPPAQQRELMQRWWDAVRQHPASYLRHRPRTLGLLAGFRVGDSRAVPYLQDRHRYRDDPELPLPVAAEAQRRLYATAAWLHETDWLSALPSLAALLLAMLAGLRRRRDALAAVGGFAAVSALLYTASFLLLAPGAELRYLTWPIAIAPLALLLACVGNTASMPATPSGRRDDTAIA